MEIRFNRLNFYQVFPLHLKSAPAWLQCMYDVFGGNSYKFVIAKRTQLRITHAFEIAVENDS